MAIAANRAVRLALFLGVVLVISGFFSTRVTRSFQTVAPYSPLQGPAAKQEPPGKSISGRVLITGGGGNIGKQLIRRLLAQSTPVTVLDILFREDELQAIQSDHPEYSSLLTVVAGDIRHPEALQQAMTRDIAGVIHLAAVSRVHWCAHNEPDCMDVNVRGTQLVLDSLSTLNKEDAGRRWFVLASTGEIYGKSDESNAPVPDAANEIPANTYASSKLGAELVLERHLAGPHAGRTRAIALRFSNVYGSLDDHPERLVPSLVTQALAHQVIQIFGGEQHRDMLHIDDCVEAFILAIQRVGRKRWLAFTSSRESLETFNIASGKVTRLRDLVDSIIGITSSSSPIRLLAGDSLFPTIYHGDVIKAAEVLGFKSRISIEEGVTRLVRAYLMKTQHFLADQAVSRCKPPLLVDLQKLDKCSIIWTGNVGGETHLLRPNQGYWTAARSLEPDLKMSITVRTTPEGIKRAVIIDGEEGRLALLASGTPWRAGRVDLHSRNQAQLAKGDVYEWDLIVDSDSGTVRFLIPNSNLQLAPPMLDGGNFTLIHQSDDPGLFRITPICCPTPGPWPFSDANPLDFTNEYQKTSIRRPFLASPLRALCSRLRRAHQRVTAQLATTTKPLNPTGQIRYSGKPVEWIQDGLPACSNLCDHPTICVDTGDCQCVLSACASRERLPFQSLAHSSDLSYPITGAHNSSAADVDLVTRVSKLSWMTVLRPSAARYINNGARFPKVYVSPPLPDTGAGLEVDFDKLRGAHCFSADSSLQRTLTLLGSRASEAEMIFVPHFQGRAREDIIVSQYKWSLNNIPEFNPEKAIIPFTTDWGQCMTWAWNAWDFRATPLTPRPASMKSMTAWSVMADLNTPCFRPQQDVAIPPRTCVSPALHRELKDSTKVRPARDRRVLAAFSGSLWGTWRALRFRIECQRTGWQDLAGKLTGKEPLNTVWGSNGDHPSYVSLLNDTIFCPLSGGIAGWAPRLIDVLYSGCIPVLFGDSAQYPFFELIDWSKISVRVSLTDVDRLEEVLLKQYTMADIERFQENIMLIRSAFIYPLDDTTDQDMVRMMVDERGPLFFALHSTGMHLATKWPTGVEYDRP